MNALSADPGGGASVVILEDALAAIVENLEALLYAAGGRMFLIADVPDLGTRRMSAIWAN